MSVKTHQINVIAQGRRVPGWKSYSVTQDVLQPANSFSLDVQFTREAWDLLDRDIQVDIFLDTTRILSGFIDRREKVSSVGSGSLLRVSGRDKTGRLVDESAPLLRYGGLRIKDLAEKLVGDLFEDGVTLVNTDNRFLLRNVRSRQAKISREPYIQSAADVLSFRFTEDQVRAQQRAGTALETALDVYRPLTGYPGLPPRKPGELTRVIKRPPIVAPGIFKGSQAPKKVPPGASRWQVLEEVLAEARLMAWSSADGRTLYVGLPAYDQEVQYYFFEPGANSGQRHLGNAKITVVQDVADMYSAYTAVGAARGSGSSYGSGVTKNRATVYDNPEGTNAAGVGLNFQRRKWLLVSDDGVKNQRDALERAEREKLEREANHLEVTVEVAGHSQVYAGEEPTIYAVDTVARVIDDDTGLGVEEGWPRDWYITQVNFQQSPNAKTMTTLKLVPAGTLLVT